ncbi:V-set and Ig domain-containing protein [Electrophorus electricus]|uniref:V-set and Ig domain-containing protein n=1 Tax=Electrophorus electricus TaxID=8005 RepID=UPI0015CFCCC8|nr:V-set and Ig domain-containing protein [Electrophorus electricus]
MDSQALMITLFLLLHHSTGPAAHDDSWSMKVPAEVRAIEGYPAVLPCSFTHPHGTQHTSMHVMWRLGHGHTGTELFRCSSLNGSQHCQPGPHQDQRYRLEGNHRAHDLSLRINSATLEDSGRYYCRVELPGQPQGSYENKMGTRLRVEAPPRILSLTVVGSADIGLKALCQVQGSPLPDIQWMGPDDILDADTRPPLSQEAAGQHHTTSQLLDIQPGGQYTCTASNPLGKDQATVYILLPSQERSMKKHRLTALPLILGLALGVKVLLALGLGTWMIKGSIKP